MKILDTMIDQISGSFVNYLNLGTWFNHLVGHHLSGRRVKEFDSVEGFWQSISNEELGPGDKIFFPQSYVSEWVPRVPGQIWFAHKDENRISFAKGFLGHMREGKAFWTQSSLDSTGAIEPLGVVRLPFGEDKLHFAALSLTTIDSWYCDLGVPLVFSASVYDAFIRKRIKQNSVEASLTGYLRFGNVPLLQAGLLKSIGSDISDEFLARISAPTSMPSAYIHVISPLDVQFRSHNTHPPGCLWAVERSVHIARVKHYPQSRKSVDTPCEPYASYGLLISHVNLNERDHIQYYVGQFKKASCRPPQLPEQHERADLASVEVLTEFDSRNRYFATSVPIEKTPWNNKVSSERIQRTLSELSSARQVRRAEDGLHEKQAE